MKQIFKSILGLGYLFYALSAVATEPEPLAMVKRVTAQMLTELDRNLAQPQKNPNEQATIIAMVNRILVPHLDLTNMSRAVVGGNHWQKASPATCNQFTTVFTKYVISTYASALKAYDGEQIKFYPIRGEITDRTKVDSELTMKDNSSIRLQYSLLKKGEQWLINDFSVDGVSMIKNYQAQFASVLNQGGLERLVMELQKRNAK